jgi:hypothetical protein
VRHVLDAQPVGGENGGAEDGQRRVLRTAGPDLAGERNASGVKVCMDSAWISSRMRSPSAR